LNIFTTSLDSWTRNKPLYASVYWTHDVVLTW